MGADSETLQCDLVMRGGITSGIVYPRAIAKLAETYIFRSIGGTFHGTWKNAAGQKPWRSYDELLRRGELELRRSYPLHRPGQQDFALNVTDEFVDFVGGWTTDDETFDRDDGRRLGRSPRPKPVLRMVPSGSNDPRDERADQPKEELPREV